MAVVYDPRLIAGYDPQVGYIAHIIGFYDGSLLRDRMERQLEKEFSYYDSSIGDIRNNLDDRDTRPRAVARRSRAVYSSSFEKLNQPDLFPLVRFVL